METMAKFAVNYLLMKHTNPHSEEVCYVPARIKDKNATESYLLLGLVCVCVWEGMCIHVETCVKFKIVMYILGKFYYCSD